MTVAVWKITAARQDRNKTTVSKARVGGSQSQLGVIMEEWTYVITWLFVIANAGRILAYVPQLLAAWNCKNGASSVSRLTWGYFAFAHLAGVLYGALVIHDFKMALMFSGNLLVCVLLVAIVTWKKVMHVSSIASPESNVKPARESPWGKQVYAVRLDEEQQFEPVSR